MAVAELSVPIVTILWVLLWAFGTAIMGLLIKNSHESCTEELNESTGCCGFLSMLHVMAICAFGVWWVNSADYLFITNYFFPMGGSNCSAVFLILAITLAGMKLFQYGFFIRRVQVVFEGTYLAVTPRSASIMWGLVIADVVGLLGIGSVSGVTEIVTIQSNQKQYLVCAGRDGSIPVIGVITALWIIIFDNIAVIVIARAFVMRLRQLAQMTSKQSMSKTLYTIAHRSLVLWMITVVTSIIRLILVVAYSDNLMHIYPVNLDNLINSCCLFASFKFGDWMYFGSCAKCSFCATCAIKICGCCGEYDESEKIKQYPHDLSVNTVPTESPDPSLNTSAISGTMTTTIPTETALTVSE